MEKKLRTLFMVVKNSDTATFTTFLQLLSGQIHAIMLKCAKLQILA